MSRRASLARMVGLVAVGSIVSLAACIDSPQFGVGTTDVSGTAPSGTGAVAAGAHEGMVLVPAVMVTSSASPAAHGDDGEGDGKGKGKGKDEDKPKGGGGSTSSGGGSSGGSTSGGSSSGGSSGGGSSSGGSSSGGSSGTSTSGGAEPATTELVAVPAFWLDAREVTVAAYRRCMASGTCVSPAAAEGCTVQLGLEDHPVTCVTLEQARAFCKWQGRRLPTTQEWTAAAAGGSRRTYPWGEATPAADRLNACGSECASPGMFPASDGQKTTAAVGSFPLGMSPEGAFDLAGNVAEWTESGAEGLARGGSFEDVDVAAVSSTGARAVAPGASLPSVGFRCAADR